MTTTNLAASPSGGAPLYDGVALAPDVEPTVYPESGHGTQNLPLAPAQPSPEAWYPTGGESDEG